MRTTIAPKLTMTSLANVQGGLQRLRSTITGLAKAAAATAGIGGLGYVFQSAMKSGIQFNAVVEQQTIAFKILLGSMDAAKKRVADVTRFAAKWPGLKPQDTATISTVLGREQWLIE